jgi:hypothetical protein
MLYFATGPDMLECERLGQAGEAEQIVHGRAFGFRLAFDPANPPDRPVLERAPHMVVWGTVYRVEPDLLGLAEGNLEEVEVSPWNGSATACLAAVREELPAESVPPAALLVALEEHVHSVKQFPAGFCKFIGDLADGTMPRGEHTLLVSGHRDTDRPLHHSRVRLHSADAERLGLDRDSAVAVYGERTCPLSVEVTDFCTEGVCQLNQSARAALGMEGRWSYGQRLALHPLAGSLPAPALVQPRSLSLPLYRPAHTDSEKNIVVLHERNLELLGVAPGDFVRLRVAVSADRDSPNGYELRSHSLRAFSGSETEVRRGNDEVPYPAVTEVYVDAYGRASLGLDRNDQGPVVLVTADVWRLFLSRSVFYGGTLLLSLIALQPLADALGSVLAVFVAVAVALAVTLFDLRSRIQF